LLSRGVPEALRHVAGGHFLVVEPHREAADPHRDEFVLLAAMRSKIFAL
jgi:hypothetical protein